VGKTKTVPGEQDQDNLLEPIVTRVAYTCWITHALESFRLAAASFVIGGVQVKYEKYDGFMPTSFGPLGAHRQPKLAAADCRFICILGCRGRRPMQGASECRRFAS